MTAIFNLLNRLDLPIAGLETDGISTYLFAIIAAAAGFISIRSSAIMSKRSSIRECILTVALNQKIITVTAIADTGNLVKDPLSGKRIVLVDRRELAKIADMTGQARINSSTAKTLLSLCENSDIDPLEYAKANDLFQICDRNILRQMLQKAAESDPKSATDFKNGKATAGKALVGKVMAESRGRADAKILQELLQELKNI